MNYLILIIALVLFAIQTIRAKRLMVSAIWLAGTSALLAMIFYLLGAHQVAVIELSVGAGLVTVFFVFAISISGEDVHHERTLLPGWLIGGIIGLMIISLALIMLPAAIPLAQAAEPSLPEVMFQQRGLDVLVQVVLIFCGALGLLGLLAEAKAPLEYPVAAETAARRERELAALSHQSRLTGVTPNPIEEAT